MKWYQRLAKQGSGKGSSGPRGETSPVMLAPYPVIGPTSPTGTYLVDRHAYELLRQIRTVQHELRGAKDPEVRRGLFLKLKQLRGRLATLAENPTNENTARVLPLRPGTEQWDRFEDRVMDPDMWAQESLHRLLYSWMRSYQPARLPTRQELVRFVAERPDVLREIARTAEALRQRAHLAGLRPGRTVYRPPLTRNFQIPQLAQQHPAAWLKGIQDPMPIVLGGRKRNKLVTQQPAGLRKLFSPLFGVSDKYKQLPFRVWPLTEYYAYGPSMFSSPSLNQGISDPLRVQRALARRDIAELTNLYVDPRDTSKLVSLLPSMLSTAYNNPDSPLARELRQVALHRLKTERQRRQQIEDALSEYYADLPVQAYWRSNRGTPPWWGAETLKLDPARFASPVRVTPGGLIARQFRFLPLRRREGKGYYDFMAKLHNVPPASRWVSGVWDIPYDLRRRATTHALRDIKRRWAAAQLARSLRSMADSVPGLGWRRQTVTDAIAAPDSEFERQMQKLPRYMRPWVMKLRRARDYLSAPTEAEIDAATRGTLPHNLARRGYPWREPPRLPPVWYQLHQFQRQNRRAERSDTND